MKKTSIALVLAAAGLSAGVASAQDYQFEAGISYADFSYEAGGSDSALSIGGEYHFSPVKTSGHPLAEAAFLQNSSNLAAFYATTDESEVDTLGIGGEFYMNQLYLRGGFARGESDASGVDVTVDALIGRIGIVLTPGFRVAAGIDRLDTDIDSNLVADPEATNNTVLEAKYVTKMSGGTAVNVEGDLTFVDDEGDTTTLALAGDYYLNPMASLGLRLASSDNDAGSTTDFGVGGRMFFTPAFSGGLEYHTAGDGDDDVFEITLAARF